jgi:hypothetical protein
MARRGKGKSPVGRDTGRDVGRIEKDLGFGVRFRDGRAWNEVKRMCPGVLLSWTDSILEGGIWIE